MRALLLTLAMLAAPAAGAAAEDEILRWNRVATEASAAANVDPLTESRAFAILHLAMYDAVNAAAPRDTPYLAHPAAAPGISASSAAAGAAHEVLSAFLPSGEALFDRELERTGSDPGTDLGRAIARAVLDARRNDGADRKVDPAPGTKPGQYRPTPPDLTPAFMGQWGDIKPFALRSPAQFRPAPPLPVDSERARREVEQVRLLGAQEGAVRNDEQSESARFWYENSPQGWNRIAREVAAAQKLDLHTSARLFALVNVAMADGFISGFEAKYHYGYWRPVTAIREAGAADWLSYLITPPVPDYPSTHTVLGAAAATVLARFFGTDYVQFQMTSGAPYAGITRKFWSFSDAARENGASRVFAGIHFQNAVTEGYALGEAVGNWTFDHALRPGPGVKVSAR